MWRPLARLFRRRPPAEADGQGEFEIVHRPSDLRRRVREGRSVAYRLPEAVDAYIRARRLYRSVES